MKCKKVEYKGYIEIYVHQNSVFVHMQHITFSFTLLQYETDIEVSSSIYILNMN